MHFVTQITK